MGVLGVVGREGLRPGGVAVVAVVLIRQNRRFLVGVVVEPEVRAAAGEKR